MRQVKEFSQTFNVSSEDLLRISQAQLSLFIKHTDKLKSLVNSTGVTIDEIINLDESHLLFVLDNSDDIVAFLETHNNSTLGDVIEGMIKNIGHRIPCASQLDKEVPRTLLHEQNKNWTAEDTPPVPEANRFQKNKCAF